MKCIKPLFFVFLVLLIVPAYGGQREDDLKNIPLEWKPSNPISLFGAVDLTVYKNVQFSIKPFGDARTRPSEIGNNIEKKFSGRDMVVTTKDNVADWLTGQVAKVLSGFDISVAQNDSGLPLEADVVKFFVTEQSTYKAEVALKVRLKAKNNTLIWEGLTTGSATRFGKSYKAENYYEALSNATIMAIHGLLKNDAFMAAVQKSR
jgi:hypothetical protein